MLSLAMAERPRLLCPSSKNRGGSQLPEPLSTENQQHKSMRHLAGPEDNLFYLVHTSRYTAQSITAVAESGARTQVSTGPKPLSSNGVPVSFLSCNKDP